MDRVEAQGGQGSLYCVNHPNRETLLRCNRCGSPICLDCAVRTEVGYRCKDCVRQQQAIFYDIQALDYGMAVLISPVLGFVGALIAGTIGWLTIFLAPVAGGLIAEAVRWAARRRRGRYLWWVCAAGVVLGTGVVFLLFGRGLWSLLWLAVFAVLANGTICARLR
ncbi:MAG: hypothetical protein ACUVXG_15350 [Anaerolineae bacterium]